MPSSSRRGGEAIGPPKKRGRAEAAERAQGTHARAAGNAQRADAEEAANPPTDRVVAFNVGGTVITTLESTLRTTPSQLTEWLNNNFHGLPRDAAGRPFLDCDPKNFKYVLNYLRGYGLPAKADDLVMLAEDAVRFHMESLQRDMGVKAPPLWKFNLGPGVSPDGSQFSTADILSLCGSTALSTSLVHSIAFRIDKCDSISVGLVAFDIARTDQQIYDQRQSVCYRSSGEMVRYIGDEPLFSAGASYTNSSVMRVRVRFMPEGLTNAMLPPITRAAARAPADGAVTEADLAERTTPQQAPLPGFTTANLVDATPRPQTPRDVPPSARPPPPPPPPQAASPLSAVGAAVSGALAAPGGPSAVTEASPQAAEASVPLFPSPLSLPEVPIGAIIYFLKDDEPQFEARWPVPVPPLQFAVSMQGNSSVTIIEATSSADRDGWEEVPLPGPQREASVMGSPAQGEAPRPSPAQALAALQLPPGLENLALFAREASRAAPS